jgi:hypothetical protein
MRVLILKDYPENFSTVIESNLHTDYTLTGYYGDRGLEWILEYRGDRSTVLLEVAMSEYILEATTVDNLYEYRLRTGRGVF